VLDFWNWLHHLAVWLSVAVWFIFVAVYGSLPPSVTVTENLSGLFANIVAPMAKNWFLTLAVPVLAVLPGEFPVQGPRQFCKLAGAAYDEGGFSHLSPLLGLPRPQSSSSVP